MSNLILPSGLIFTALEPGVSVGANTAITTWHGASTAILAAANAKVALVKLYMRETSTNSLGGHIRPTGSGNAATLQNIICSEESSAASIGNATGVASVELGTGYGFDYYWSNSNGTALIQCDVTLLGYWK